MTRCRTVRSQYRITGHQSSGAVSNKRYRRPLQPAAATSARIASTRIFSGFGKCYAVRKGLSSSFANSVYRSQRIVPGKKHTRYLRATCTAAAEPGMHSSAAEAPILRDVVLLGGGHPHVEVLRQFGMRPLPGVRLTLIAASISTPYRQKLVLILHKNTPQAFCVAPFKFGKSSCHYDFGCIISPGRSTISHLCFSMHALTKPVHAMI
jgi:hypothetical protein